MAQATQTHATSGRTFRLEIISPERVLIDTPVRSIQVQAEDGMLGVLPNHAPLVTPLVPGVLALVTADGARQKFAVGAGFLEVLPNHVRLLVDSAEHPDAIDVDRAQRAAERARERLRERSRKDVDFARAEAALMRALARLKTTATL